MALENSRQRESVMTDSCCKRCYTSTLRLSQEFWCSLGSQNRNKKARHNILSNTAFQASTTITSPGQQILQKISKGNSAYYLSREDYKGSRVTMLCQQSNLLKSKYLHFRPFCLKYIFPTDYGKDSAPKSNAPTKFLRNPPRFSDLFIKVAHKLSPSAAAA